MKATATAGLGCTFATIALGHLNEFIGCMVGIVSFAAFLPLAIDRWQKFFAHKAIESKNPFKDE